MTILLQRDNQAVKAAQWRDFDRRRLPFVLSLSSKVNRVFVPCAKAVAKSVAEDGTARIATVIDEHFNGFLELWNKHYQRVENEFAAYARELMKSQWKLNVTRGAVREWTVQQVGQHVSQASTWTKAIVRRAVTRGVEEGLTLDAIAKRILEQRPGLGRGRAWRIARTETVAASNAGVHFGTIEDFGKDLTKEWLSSRDERVRDTHAGADGQRKSITKPFVLPGGKLMFPGDSSLGADASEIVNCRCTQLVYPSRGGRSFFLGAVKTHSVSALCM